MLEPDGTLVSFDDIRLRNDKGKPIPRPLLVPDGGGRSGIGLKPFFGWDNTGYVLGRDNKGKPERAEEMFAAFRELHMSFLPELASDEGFAALCRFLDAWKPARAESLPNWEEAAGLNVVFKLRGREGYIHQSDPVRIGLAAFDQLSKTPKEEARSRRFPGSGEEEELARLHPANQRRLWSEHDGRGHRLVQPRCLRELRQVAKLQRPGRHARRLPLHHRAEPPARRRLAAGLASATRRSSSGRIAPKEARPRRSSARSSATSSSRTEEAEHAATVDRVRGFLDAARQGRLADKLQTRTPRSTSSASLPTRAGLNVRYWLVGHRASISPSGWPSMSSSWR